MFAQYFDYYANIGLLKGRAFFRGHGVMCGIYCHDYRT